VVFYDGPLVALARFCIKASIEYGQSQLKVVRWNDGMREGRTLQGKIFFGSHTASEM
jgi:hypothetical protein